MPKEILLIIAFSVIVLSATLTLLFNPSKNTTSKGEIDTAINQARYLYELEKSRGRDFSKGPCLSNALLPGWVADVAHSPRENLDDLIENQCAAFVEGTAAHFVELDIDGNLIRAR